LTATMHFTNQMAILATISALSAAAPMTNTLKEAVEKRNPEPAKEYIHFDSDVLDKRAAAAKEYIHFDSDVLDKRAKEYIHFDNDILD
jgi:arginase family enzyme